MNAITSGAISVAAGTVGNKLIFGAVGALPDLSWRQAAIAAAVGVGVAMLISAVIGGRSTLQ